MMYRFFDVLIAGSAIMILSFLLIPICLILRFTGEKKIFYLQDRIGLGGKIFKLIKFATMLENSPNLYNGTITIRDDPRILPFGKILRKSKLNELPQLMNILNGSISLIGPRPLVKNHFSLYSQEVQKQIITVKPGLSGIGSIIFRDEEKWISESDNKLLYYKTVIAPYKGDLEIWYINNKSIFLYFGSILATVIVILNSNSNFVWYLFKGMPLPPKELANKINFKSS